VTPVGIVTVVRLVPPNALAPIVLTELGMLIDFNNLLLTKAYEPILVIVSGNTTDIRLGQSRRALSSIAVTDDDIITLGYPSQQLVPEHSYGDDDDGIGCGGGGGGSDDGCLVGCDDGGDGTGPTLTNCKF